MTVYYLIDQSKQDNQTAETGFYTSVYMEEMVSRLGVPATCLHYNELNDVAFCADDVILLGADKLSNDSLEILQSAAEAGTLIMGFGTQNSEKLFGYSLADTMTQSDPYETIGYFHCNKHNVDLPIVSDIVVTNETGLGYIQVGEKQTAGLITGENTVFFPFDLPDTIMKIVQGKPISGPSSYFPLSRTPDSRVLSYDYDSTVACVDMYYLMIEGFLAKRGVPMLHTLPMGKNDLPADLLLYFGGDDDNTSAELDERASQIMYDRGLPYHINLMPGSPNGDYTLTKEQYDVIRARGHELALHYDMTGMPFTKESFETQMASYKAAYGELPVSNVAHCLIQSGMAEYARFQSELGAKGDNSRMGYVNLADINAFNVYDFGFGTAFPHYVYDDEAHGGKRLDFCGIPISYYEPRLGGQYGDSDEKINQCISTAAQYGQAINMFSHPHYVANYNGYDSSMTLRAFDRALEICKENDWNAYLAGVDEWCLWWRQRAESQLHVDNRKVTVSVAGEDPMLVKIPAGCVETVSVDGNAAEFFKKSYGGIEYALIPVSGKGEHIVTY